MPTTVNGVGTHYYGKRNWSTRTAPCHSCGKVEALESYDTRLWFVVIFIPIIPLGRKRIIDSCPSCRRHIVADADKYEQARQLQTSGSLERFRREGTPESALEAHAQLLSFHEHDQAAELRSQALARFPGDARLRAALAEHMRQVSSFEEMARLHEEALALDPDLPEARAGVATWRMAYGQLDEARRLLDFLEEPGAGHRYNLGPLYTLAQNLQKAGRHEEALAVAAALAREAPDLGQQADFRNLVSRSERAAGRGESLLPDRKHSLRGLFRAEGSPYTKGQRRLALFAAGLVLAAGGLVVSNEYIRRHRTIRVVNACGAPVQVSIDDGPPVAVDANGSLPVSEGHHRVRLTGAVEATHEVDLSSGYFQRWTSSPLWVLNPGGEAVLDRMTVYYAENPQPAQQTLILGRPFVALAHVDYPFEDPPQQLQVKGRNTVVTKEAIRWIQGQDTGAFYTVSSTDRAAALDFAEGRLRRRLDDDLLSAYLHVTSPADRPRAEAFFRAGLGRRPLSVPWHRAYQDLADHDGGQPRLIAEYDALLAKEPDSAALLYLRGRIDTDAKREAEFFRRSMAADPQLPWPVMALGMKALSLGQWDEALRDLRKAQDLKIDEPGIAPAIHTARMGLGQAKELVGEYRTRLTASPNDPTTLPLLFDALAASGQAEAIEPERAAWDARLPVAVREGVGRAIRGFALYLAGRPDEAARLCREAAFPGSPLILAHSLAATGHADEAAADPGVAKFDDPWAFAAVALGLALEGQADKAASWREKACVLLDARSDEERKAAAILRAAAPTPLEAIDDVYFRPGDKALLLALLAERFPEKRAEYHEVAARLNVVRLPSYLLVRRALEREAPKTP